ncbi:hypothetical protein [Fructilactobacillus fructivorans]|uniref:hypothetical protein n=1 Tax=Fructilactobacillus fructivorans TaxID=1614 RepID=UPI00223AFC0D|nr:hypothetical protein [Fructilactobacillus fructivorans]MCT0151112.1 hypothetical protein [Fructilactobacillus fructivorans]MCT2867330.1 hypothetical protein [Fructilactobacillus fructivorans]MCT2869151.1 hypothetical protein [Fructilactobacillus fructivorans]MCT2873129.1 hypothetical protein [Fructilactobacillus fructivorans]
MKHIIKADNGRVFKRLVSTGVNEDSNQFDFNKIRPIPQQIQDVIVDNFLSNAAIGVYMVNVDFNRDDIPSTVEALAADMNQNGDEFYDKVERDQQKFLSTFMEVYGQFEQPMDDKMKEATIASLQRGYMGAKKYLIEDNIDLEVFKPYDPEEILQPDLRDGFQGIDLNVLAWLSKQGEMLINNYIAFQAFNEEDWTNENWRITENAFDTELDKKENTITFHTYEIVGLTDLFETLLIKSDSQADDVKYSYEL